MHRDAVSTAEGYADGTLTPPEVVAEIQAVIDEREPELNALWVRDDVGGTLEQARASARRWEERRPLSPLDGVTVTLKENVARAGVPMSMGCAGVEPVVPQTDSPVARRCREAGLVVLGSTVMPDWGMLSSGVSSRHGITRSPLNPAWTTGGSSSGAGAAAAGGYGPLHVGTDIGGSIRLPGTWLGLATLKPSAGRIPLHAPYLGRAAGPMARTARDCALLMGVLAGPDPVDWTSLPAQEVAWDDLDLEVEGLRVALWTEAGYGVEPEPEIVATVEDAALRLERAGARVERIGPWLTQDQLDGVDRFWQARSWADYARLAPEQQARVLPYIVEWVSRARDLSGTEVMDAYHAFAQVQSRTTASWAAAGDPDVLLSPVAPGVAFPAEQPMPYPEDGRGLWHINFAMPWNMTGQPAGTADAGRTADGRPIGVQVVGRPFDDLGTLRVMHALAAS
ncbi:Amidase [Serinicoccus hydrothermalis]|uniref:Amidase n=1 Tax=Serinicoccus hydrothermalis TaxID=1758689 RepID=A0A1B1NCJ2_9MICO|nr:amidase [Serinicoccus hydrothermalis]ANS79159.1 Amidase [Serinicoccus hydrothermalis]